MPPLDATRELLVPVVNVHAGDLVPHLFNVECGNKRHSLRPLLGVSCRRPPCVRLAANASFLASSASMRAVVALRQSSAVSLACSLRGCANGMKSPPSRRYSRSHSSAARCGARAEPTVIVLNYLRPRPASSLHSMAGIAIAVQGSTSASAAGPTGCSTGASPARFPVHRHSFGLSPVNAALALSAVTWPRAAGRAAASRPGFY